MARKFVFITDIDATAVILPSDWNNVDNKVHTFGGGAGGRNSSWAGGGGGAYKWKANIPYNANDSVPIQVGAPGVSGLIPTDGGETYFGGSSIVTADVGARGGLYDRSGLGGLGGDNTGPGDGGYEGGNGCRKTGNVVHGFAPGGGGGAGGPNGPGFPGGADSSGNPFGPGGGKGDNGTTPQHSSGNEFTDGISSVGSGSGACGDVPAVPGFGSDAGLYGAGGTKGRPSSGGLIVLEYTPV